jgi:hypothetical protein
MPVPKSMLRDDNDGDALSEAPAAFETPGKLRERNLAPAAPRDLARIGSAGVTAPAAEEPDQPLGAGSVANAGDRSAPALAHGRSGLVLEMFLN